LIRNDRLLLNVQKNEEAYLRYVIRSRQTIEKLDHKEELEVADVVKRAG
jgi:hypothetical protein